MKGDFVFKAVDIPTGCTFGQQTFKKDKETAV